MNKEAIELLYKDLQSEYDLGTLEDFIVYLNDDTKRQKFYNEVISQRYDVGTIQDFETTYGLKKKDEEQVLESDSGFVQRGIISDTERPIQVGQSESSPGIDRPFTKQYMENRYSINKPQDLQKETPQESPQPQLEAPKCDPATQVFDASSNQCVDISSVTEVFSDNEKITFNSLLKENPGLELSKNKRGNYILYSEGKLGREGQWYVLTDKGLEKGKDMGAEKGFTVGIDVIPMADVDSFDYTEIQAEGPEDSFSITEKAENERKEKRNKVEEAFEPEQRDVTITENEAEKEKELKLQQAADELYKTGFDSQRDGDLFRKYINEDENRKAMVDQHLKSLGLTVEFTADENQPYNSRSMKEAIKVAGKDYLQYLDQTKVQKTVQDYLSEGIETYKDNPIISGALNVISKSPVVNALTSTADLIKNKSELVKDFLEPRIEELNKNFDKFEQVYNTINSEYYNYEGDAPPIFDVDGASTAKAEAKMITDFNAEFVDPVTGIVNIPYDEVKKISEKTGLSEDDVRKFAKQYELLYMDNMDKDLDLEYTSFQLKRYKDHLADAGMVDPNAKDHETALGRYYFDKENYGRNALKKFPFDDKEITDEIFNTKLYDLNEDEFSDMMTSIFSPYGVNFYPVAKGSDVVKAVARNGEEFSINLMAYKKVKDKEGKNIKELQNFLERNTSSRGVLSLEDISRLKSGFALKAVDGKWFEYNKNKINRASETLKTTNEDIEKEVTSFNSSLEDKQKQEMKKIAASVGITEEEFNASMVEFSERIGLSDVYKDIEKGKVPEVFMSLLNKGIQRQVDNGIIKTEEQFNAVQKNLDASLKAMGQSIDREIAAFNDHMTQKQESLKERALDFDVEFQDFYKATENHYNMQAQMGSWLGFTWDNLLTGASSLASGTASTVFDLGEATGVLNPLQAQDYREEYLPAIRNSLTDSYGAGTYDAYSQEMEKTFLGGAWGGLMKSFAPIAVSIVSGGLGAAAFAIQQVDYLDQEFENDPDLKDLSLADKWIMKAPIAIVNGVLEKFGVTQTLKGGNSLSTRLLINGLNKIEAKGTAKQLVNIIEADVNNLIARGLIRISKGGIIEFETGFLQQLNETSVKELYDHYIDDSKKNLFETALDKGWGSLLSESLYAGAQEAIGGFIMAGPVAINKGIQEKNLGKLSTDLQFEFIEAVINDPMSRSMYNNLFKQLIASKKFSKREVRMWQESLDKAEAIINQINPNADISDRKKSFDLINEKKNLEQEVAGKDKFTVQEKYDRINEINKELAEISKYASENVNTIGETPILNKVRQEDNITDADNEIIEQAENIIYGSPKDKKGATKGSKGQVVLTRDQVQKAKKELDELIDRLDNSGSLESMELADELRAMSEAVSNQPVNHSIYFNERVNDENAQKVHNELVEKNQFKPKTTYIINNKEVSAREFDGKMKDPAFQQELKDGKSSYSVINAPESKIAELEGMPTKPKEGKPVIKVTEEVAPEAAPEVTEVVIDKPAITENTTDETNRIKGLDAKAEDGQTFNLDGTTYNEGGLVVPVMSINTTQEEITPEKIAEFVEQNQESIGDAGVVKVGIYKFPNSNQVSIDLNIVVPSENREVALEFGRLAGQESLFDLSTFENVKTGSDGKNPVSFTPEQFRQIASALKENKLPGVFEQEAAVKEEVTPEVTEEVVEDKSSKERVDRIVNEIIDKVKKRNFGEDTSPKVILKATKGYLQGSKLYSELTDTERNTAIRSLNEKLGIKIKKAPSIRQAIKRFETVTGRRRDKKIVVNDVAALKDQIRLEARAARGAVKAYKDISKSIIEDVKKLSKKGVITPSQSSAIIKKVLSTNMMNPKMVDRLTEYIDKVYKKAELAEKIAKSRNKLKQAKTNLKSKVGASPELQNVLDELFSIDPSLIPLDKFDSYFEIIERFGARKAVLNLPEAGEVMSQATDIINSVETNIEEEVKDPVSKEKNKEIEDNLDSYIADIISEKINTENLYNQEGKDIADYLSKLTKEDLLSLVKEKKDGTKDYSDLEKLKLVKNNMSNGFVPKMSMDLKIKVESNRSSKEINDVTSKIKETSLLTGFSRIYGSLKGLVTGKSKMTESVRGTATFYIDDIFGNFNSKTIWNNTFGRLAKAYSRYESDLAKNVTSKLDAAEVLLSKTKIPTIQRQRNDIQRSKVKIMAYRLQREFESNPGNKQVASANSFIEETIKAMERREANSRLNKQEIKILKEIQNKFLVDGEISLDKIEKSFTNNEKKALDLIDEIGVYLEPKAVFTSSVIRGGKIKPINNYVHHSVMNKDKVEDVNNKKDRMVKPSTKAGTLRERTPGAKPIKFDPISSTLSGATETLLDYHMTETVKTVNASIKKAKDQIYDNEDSSNISKEAIVALEESVDEVMSKTFSNSFVEYDPFSKTIKKLQKLGYQAALASVPRAGAELGSNMLFAISSNPQGFINGVKKYSGFAMGNEGMNAMENLGSTETMKLYDTKNMTGKMADSNVLYTGKPKASKAVSPVVEKAEYLSQFSGVKQVKKFADELSDKLISTPDKAVSRPLWFGNFSSNFKKMTGITLTEKDFIEIADGSSKYLSKEYKQAVEESTKFADQESVKMATSSNPFNVIPKNISTPDEAVYKQIYKNANSYMARFSQYEYATARNAIVSLFKAGKLTKKQALGTLIGTQMRMASYMILYSSLRSAFDRLFGFEDEEEEDYKTMIKRQLVGSPLSLLTGRGLGNVPKIAINYGLELFNEEYLEDLRDGKEYDSFKHSLVFSQISPGDKRDPYEIFLNTMTGPLSPLAKTAARTYKVYTKSKDPELKAETRAKYKEELSTRMLLEGLGNLGFIPFYKDIRRMFLKDFFKGYKEEQKAKEDKKKDKELMKYRKSRMSGTQTTKKPKLLKPKF